jgi:ribosomal protein S18 acetylase RimI-like enzyme
LADESQEPKFVIEPLGPEHDRAAFSCGSKELDSYLQKQAGQDLKKRAAVPFVITPDHRTVAGFYTLSQYALDLGSVPEEVAKRLPRYPMVSATLLGRLAVSNDFRDQGLGERLLMDALYRALASSQQIASAAVVVDAKDEQAITFYTKYGFIELPRVNRRLFLPMGTIEQLFARGE